MQVRKPLLVCLLLVFSLAGLMTPATQATLLQDTTPQIVDDFTPPLPSGTDGNNVAIGFFVAQDGNSNTTFAATDAPPAPVPDVPTPNHVLKMDFTVSAYGVVIHNFENDAVNQWVSQDWSSYGGFALWVYGTNTGTDLFIDVIDNRNPGSTRDDAERFTVTFEDNFSGWQYKEFPFSSFIRKEIGNGAPNDGFTLSEVYGWAFGSLTTSGTRTFYIDNVTLYGTAPVRPLTVGFAANSFPVAEGGAGRVTVKLSKASAETVTVNYSTQPGLSTVGRDYTPTSGTLTFAPGTLQQTFTVATLEDAKDEAEESVVLQLDTPTVAELGLPSRARLAIQDNDPYDSALLDDFEIAPDLFDLRRNSALSSVEIPANSPLALPGQGEYERVLSAKSASSPRSSFQFGREFAAPEDWSDASGLSFWYYGRNTGRNINVQLLDNAAADPGSSQWKLAWSDEFNERAGTPPKADNWSHEIGDGTAHGNLGWGNSELEYYTNSPENAATDGQGNLAITVKKLDESSNLRCYYGPCQYTSARLISKNKAEFAYGRIESRIKVARGAGIWPAFWALGADIDRVNWPQTGEIDIMEYVGREPNRVFGTIHGPGYSGGESYGGTYDFPQSVADSYHTFAVEWQPNKIVWYVDGIQYHEADPADVAPDQWVFNHSFFLLLNVAVGGNFGGPVGGDTTFPQTMKVDYVRVYQAADTAERFQAAFADNFAGWKKVTVPFTSFVRSASQPAGAPNDGLTLSAVNGYGFEVPGGMSNPVLIDQVRLNRNCSAVTVTTNADSGAGSLRQALASVCDGGTISFAPSLSGQTIALSTAELTVAKSVKIDGSAAQNLTISGGGTVRPFVINAGVSATIQNLTIANGYGFELAGGILNNGTLTLDHVTIANNTVTTSGQDYWKGGAGVYSGASSGLTIRNSTIRDNTVTGGDGGGVYAFTGTQVTIDRSTISGNTSSNVGGGIRTLGDAQIVNSTISGNTAGAWHGGAFFHTDGTMSVVNSTIANNTSPSGASGGAFVGTFGDSSPTLSLTNTIVAGNSGWQCQAERAGSGLVTLASGGHNLASDGSCQLTAAGDLPSTAPQLGALADNGGPTRTHLLLSGSPAINAADAAACPATDQRGISRPQGAGCDIGAVEVTP
ncbi:MAG TPA: family 16 glycosylhydrolase [Herpetosiphonaceae bacterium]